VLPWGLLNSLVVKILLHKSFSCTTKSRCTIVSLCLLEHVLSVADHVCWQSTWRRKMVLLRY